MSRCCRKPIAPLISPFNPTVCSVINSKKIQKFVVLLLRLTFLPITRDDDILVDIGRNSRLPLLPSAPGPIFGAIFFRYIAASWSCFDKISFLSFSAFNSLRSCALVLFPSGHKTRCCIKDIAEGLISGLG